MANIEVYLFGAAIVDAVARPVGPDVFSRDSTPAEHIALSTGGDALNEATVLSRLGRRAALRTTLGDDGAARFIRAHAAREGIALDAATLAGVPTGVNLVLVDPAGERHFVTDPGSTLRRFTLEDALAALDTDAFRQARIATLASLFVSPQLGISEMACLIGRCRAAGKLTCADSTRAKHGETARALSPVLSQLDWFFPNASEAAVLTGETDPEAIARALLYAGAGHVALKLGGEGCLIADGDGLARVPAMPGVRAVDSTGAGDTFAAAFQCALLEGRAPVECAAFANAAASVCVEHVGATEAEMDREEIGRRMERVMGNTLSVNS
ncbi:MAG: carbohydrate kinase family protein [Clostridiales bacterium]|nr:carbohydrate kinase family protein [Clostridiales bacterium]